MKALKHSNKRAGVVISDKHWGRAPLVDLNQDIGKGHGAHLIMLKNDILI